MSVITIFSASYDEHDHNDTILPSNAHSELSADELCLPESFSHDERCSSASISASSASTSSNSSSSSLYDLPASSSFSSVSLSPLRPASPCPVPVAPLAELSHDLLGSLLACLTHPPFSPSRTVFLTFAKPNFLRALFSLQLATHLIFLAASIWLLLSKQQLVELQPEGVAQSGVFQVMKQLPAWLLARSVVSCVLSARRIWLGRSWRSSVWEAVWCGVAMWLSTLVFGVAAMLALGALEAGSDTVYVVMWLVVAVLLLLVAAQMRTFGICLLYFSLSALTINMPMLPLDSHFYPSSDLALSPRAKRNQGLTQHQLDALPSTTCTTKRDDSCCAICMDDVDVGHVQRVLRCGHGYHQQCIDPWLLKKRVCPLCVRAVRVASRLLHVSVWWR